MSNKTVDVVVSLDSISSSLNQAFLYDASNTPYVTQINPKVLSVLGILKLF